MASRLGRGAKRALRWALLAYALVMTIAALPSVRENWDAIFGPNDVQLLIVTAAAIRDVSVIYDGRRIEPRPGSPMREIRSYAAFPAMRTRNLRPVLQVVWEGPQGRRSVSQIMQQYDSGRVCLYVLNLDSTGVPVGPAPPDEHSPFWWTCHHE